jgi:hypothetical protein
MNNEQRNEGAGKRAILKICEQKSEAGEANRQNRLAFTVTFSVGQEIDTVMHHSHRRQSSASSTVETQNLHIN